MIELEKVQTFMRLLHKVENVKRVARVPDEDEFRNTAEHTFEVALLCWYLNSVNRLGLDQEKIFKYALCHDLIEAYAGDTYIYDEDAQQDKKQREADALSKIESEFSEFTDLIDSIHVYEAREDEESKFVYAVDKLVDPLNISMETKESLWQKMNVSYEELRKYKDDKIGNSKTVTEYWHQLLSQLEEKRDFFFPKRKE